MGAYIDRKQALSHPFANGKYDHEHANEHFILGFESYREWLEQLPTIDIVRCEECEWSNGECSVGERYQGGCTFGERRNDEHNT